MKQDPNKEESEEASQSLIAQLKSSRRWRVGEDGGEGDETKGDRVRTARECAKRNGEGRGRWVNGGPERCWKDTD